MAFLDSPFNQLSSLSGLYLLLSDLMNITDSLPQSFRARTYHIYKSSDICELMREGPWFMYEYLSGRRCWPYDQSIYRSKPKSVLSPRQTIYFDGTRTPPGLVTSSCFVIQKSLSLGDRRHILDIHSLPIPCSIPS